MDEKVIMNLDLTDCKYLLELHQRIKSALDFPDYYGCNWSAFHDMLRGEIDAEQIEIYGEASLPKDWTEQIALMHAVLEFTKDERKQFGEDFEYVVIN